ncbi:rRNA methyltransferase 2, mitochondrial-like [Limulus polyphemus]|uniref:rRNA methyltransferase 2, mitochondrial n=1 Tax=Limulus polyphemus TaxID=6850 RepID=A0ABM1TBG3_LIMPO|nr:rRNA methyltransferase 2, mitochondrial-like [Limulus polyphemus]XP_022253219.1 rRNA methyltransferase 2, mitochondrial-like [Limulus polyphemus]
MFSVFKLPVCLMTTTRSYHVSSFLNKIQPQNLKNKSKSSQEWLSRQLNDPYIKKARYHNYRARSAFKLLEINERFQLLKPGMMVVECGAAPGAWTQVLVEKLNQTSQGKHLKGRVIALDIKSMEPVMGAETISGVDCTEHSTQDKVLKMLGNQKVDIVLSDMAPNATGIKEMDHEQITSLAYSALTFSFNLLQVESGVFLCKIWEGKNTERLASDLKKFFKLVKHVKPASSRTDSSELYFLAKGFRGITVV